MSNEDRDLMDEKEDVAVEEISLLTDEDIELLNEVNYAMGMTSDVRLSESYDKTKAEHARGFLEAASIYATDREVAVIYHILKAVLAKYQK